MTFMITLRRGAAIAGATSLLAALVGCSVAANTPAPRPTPKHTSAPVAAVPLPVAVSIALPAQPPAPAVSPACAGNQPGVKHIIVSISQQHLYACDGQALFTDGPVTTGASAIANVDDSTPIGTFHILDKAQNTVLSGGDVNGQWNDPVQYWMPFTVGGCGFHDASWQNFPLGSPLYTTQGSHCCVHVGLDVVSTMFYWAQVDTLVTVES
ncbi:lipoprotein-anchoring transpeptidase ErfK/SrfK [Leifsonia sp. EB34]